MTRRLETTVVPSRRRNANLEEMNLAAGSQSMRTWSGSPASDGDGREERCIANANPVSEQTCRREFEQASVQRGEGSSPSSSTMRSRSSSSVPPEPARRCIAATRRGSSPKACCFPATAIRIAPSAILSVAPGIRPQRERAGDSVVSHAGKDNRVYAGEGPSPRASSVTVARGFRPYRAVFLLKSQDLTYDASTSHFVSNNSHRLGFCEGSA